MNIAFIPVRGGSKSIPLKNIKELNGKPLVYWVVKAASESSHIDRIYVSTDSGLIRSTVEGFGLPKVCVVDRSAESACDSASTESAMLEFAEKNVFDNIVLIQATSPLLKAEDIDGGFEVFEHPDCDSVLSVVRQYRFIWKEEQGEPAYSVNYDVFNRPRRQDFEGYLMENGAFYITSRDLLLKSRNRVSGRIKTYEMPEDTAFEIDEPNDWIIISQLMKKRCISSMNKPKIRMLLTDCDGCLTDGGMYYSEMGDELKKFNTRDGMAFAMLREKGIITGIVTGENVELNRRRAEKLHIDELHMGIKDKLSVVNALSKKYSIPLDEIAYIGDDINDLPVLQAVGLACCPKDAAEKVAEAVDLITEHCGGCGVIREVAEYILQGE
ncbi:MAG: cytidylyltransferase domain-containing protein [Oscillospiraceae bacterium]